MFLGVDTHFIMKFDFEAGLQFAQDLGLKGIEVAAGGQFSKEYCDLDKLLADDGDRQLWLDTFARYNLEISSLSCHGSPLSPNEEIAVACNFDISHMWAPGMNNTTSSRQPEDRSWPFTQVGWGHPTIVVPEPSGYTATAGE